MSWRAWLRRGRPAAAQLRGARSRRSAEQSSSGKHGCCYGAAERRDPREILQREFRLSRAQQKRAQKPEVLLWAVGFEERITTPSTCRTSLVGVGWGWKMGGPPGTWKDVSAVLSAASAEMTLGELVHAETFRRAISACLQPVMCGVLGV